MVEQKHQGQPGSRSSVAALEQPSIETLKASLRGELLQPGDEGYDAARKVYNGMIDRHPRLIVRCAGVADVITAVNYAREHHLITSVRGGGHNVVGFAVCDDGVVIDLSSMKGMWIDLLSDTIRVEAGLTWGEVNHDLQLFGLGATGGYVSSTGVAGLTLGGGFGWLVRKHILTQNIRYICWHSRMADASACLDKKLDRKRPAIRANDASAVPVRCIFAQYEGRTTKESTALLIEIPFFSPFVACLLVQTTGSFCHVPQPTGVSDVLIKYAQAWSCL